MAAEQLARIDRLPWLRDRQSGIGSSDAPCIVGVGFRPAADIYRSKVEPVADEPNDLLDLGTALEPHVADRYEREMGCILLAVAANVRHPDRPWQIANVDRRRADTRRPVELKTVGGFGDEWGEPGTADVPRKYWVQVQHQLGVIGEDSADLAALCRISGELRIYRIPFDAPFFAWLTEIEAFFWDHVEDRVPLGAKWAARVADLSPPELRAVAGSRVELGDDTAELCRRCAELKAVMKECEAGIDAITAELAADMGTAEAATAPGFRLKWVTRKAHIRPAVDVKESRYLDIRTAKDAR